MSPWAKDQVKLSNLLFEIGLGGLSVGPAGTVDSAMCDLILWSGLWLRTFLMPSLRLKGHGPLGAPTLLHWPIASETAKPRLPAHEFAPLRFAPGERDHQGRQEGNVDQGGVYRPSYVCGGVRRIVGVSRATRK